MGATGQGGLPLYRAQFIVSTRQFTSGIQTMDVYQNLPAAQNLLFLCVTL